MVKNSVLYQSKLKTDDCRLSKPLFTKLFVIHGTSFAAYSDKMFRFKTMKKTYLLALALILPVQSMAANSDSVYTWGSWSQGIQPAAGPAVRVTPPPADRPQVNFRPNEASVLNRTTVATRIAQVTPPAATAVVEIATPPTPIVAEPTSTPPAGDPRTRR